MKQKNIGQILILEDLGISQSAFEKLFLASRLPLSLIWDEKKAKNKKNVLGIITIKKPITKIFLDQYPALKFIAVAFTGYDSIDLNVCREKKIAIFNVPTYATASVAELTVGLAISLLRHIPLADKTVRQGGWILEKQGHDLAGKTVGIMGTGTIGLTAAKLFKALGCNLIGWSKTQNAQFKDLGGKYFPNLSHFLAKADIVSVHVPLSQETRGLLGNKELAMLQKSAMLINTSRGPIIKTRALIQALQKKKIAGAALDVFDQEPLPKNDPLLKLPNLILTPHIAYKTAEALERRAQITLDNIQNFLKNKKINRVI